MRKDISYYIKKKIHQDGISILNICAPNAKAPTFLKETLFKLKPYIKSHTLVVEDFNSTPSPMDRSSRQKLNREMMKHTDIVNQMKKIDIYRTFHTNTKEKYLLINIRSILQN